MATRFGHVSLQMLDKLGVTVSAPIYVQIDDTKTIATALTEAASLAAAVDGVSDSQITEVRLVLVGPLPGGGKTAPAATAENERTGLFNFSQSGSPYKYGQDIPAFASSLIVSGKINLSAAAVTALITALTVAGSALTPVSTAPHVLLALIDALLSFRKHRKAESRRSVETP